MVKFLIILKLCLISLSLAGQPSLSGKVSTNLDLNTIPVSDKLEFSFKINRKVPVDYAEPHNPEVIEIFAVLTKGNKTITVNAFYDEEVEETGNCNGPVHPTERYPRTQFTYKNNNDRLAAQRWVIRHAFRLDETGVWSLVIKARDNINPGKVKDLFSATLNVVANPGSKGFIGLKKDRKNFLYTEDGDMCFMIGMTEHFSDNSKTYVCRMRDVIDNVSMNNANFLKLWIDGNPEWFFAPVIQGVAGKSGSEAEYHTTVFNSKNAKMVDIYIDYAKTKKVNVQMVMNDPLNLDDQGYWEGWKNYHPFNRNHDTTHPTLDDNTKYYNAPVDGQLLTNPWNYFPPIPAFPSVYKILDYQKFLLRYCTSRWGYASNLVAWEIGKEINLSAPELKIGKHTADLDHNGIPDTTPDGKIIYTYDKTFKQPPDMALRFAKWLEEGKNIVRSNDAGNHLITTSSIDPFVRGGNPSPYKKYPLSMEQFIFFSNLDISISGHYFLDPICPNSNACKRSGEKEESLFSAAKVFIDQLKKPYHLQEWGQGDDDCDGVARTLHQDIDPFGFDLHNVTLSSAFAGGFGSALSFNAYFSIQPLHQYFQYKGLGNFMKQYKDLGNVVRSDFFRTNANYKQVDACRIDENMEGLRIAYMMTVDDSNVINILGWCQDKKFSLTKLYWNNRNYLLTLHPSSRPLTNTRQSFELQVFNNSLHKIEWFETVEGTHLAAYDTLLVPVLRDNRHIISISFPRDLHNSIYADALFRIIPDCRDALACTENKLHAFPNPTKEKIRITNYIDGLLFYENIRLTNSVGQVIRTLDKTTSQTYLDLSDLRAGVYYISLSFEGRVETFKILRE